MAPLRSDPDDSSPSSQHGALAGRKITLGLSGGIACYKSASLASLLVQEGAAVRVLMTNAATKFITPLTLQSLSGLPVLSSIWQSDDHPDSQHIGVARWCDSMVLAPATADLIARIAHGLTSDVVSLVASAVSGSAAQKPVLLAPAMNADMWANPITQRNLATVRDFLGYHIVGPEEGWQACRTSGPGRMSEPGAILDALLQILNREHEGA